MKASLGDSGGGGEEARTAAELEMEEFVDGEGEDEASSLPTAERTGSAGMLCRAAVEMGMSMDLMDAR